MKVAVTGAFGYSGRYITRRLLEAGHTVLTLTNSPERRSPIKDAIEAVPFHFDQPERLVESLHGVESLINTYWVRFNHRLFSHQHAVANSRVLFDAAREAGVRRIVHVSITNPDIHSEMSYFRGKAEVESALVSTGVSHCILRPAVLFGKEDILINNIAWALRHLPVFGVFGSGDYRLQPIYVDDLAAAVEQATRDGGNQVINAIGPQTFTFRGMVETIRQTLGLKRMIVGVPPSLGYWACRLMGLFVNDVIITRQEIRGLMQGRLYVDAPPLGTTKLTDWIEKHKQTLGRQYTSEMARRTDRRSAYQSN
jgi:NADH dehydrogenase